MSEMKYNDFRVHFRYHDGIDSLVGMERYRYEPIMHSDIPELTKSLAKRGMDQFAWRRLNTLEQWQVVDMTEFWQFHHPGAVI